MRIFLQFLGIFNILVIFGCVGEGRMGKGKMGEEELLMAYDLEKSKEYARLEEYLSKIDVDRHTSESLRLWGKVKVRQKKYFKALEHLKNGESLITEETKKGDQVSLYSLLGYTYQKVGKWRKALESHEKVSKLLPGNAVGWANMGLVYYELKDYEGSRRSYEKSYGLNKGLNKGKKKKGKKGFKTAVIGLAKSYDALGEKKEAIKYYREGLKLGGGNSKLYLRLGELLEGAESDEMRARGYFLGKEYGKAKDYLRRVEGFEGDRGLHQFYITILIEKGEYEEARRESRAGLRRNGMDSEYALGLAQSYIREKEYEKALGVGLKYMGDGDDLMDRVVANMYLLLGEEEKSKIFYERLLKMKEGDIESRSSLAQIYREGGEKDLEFFHQGIVYIYTGDIEQAKEVLSWVRGRSGRFKRLSELMYYRGKAEWLLGNKVVALDLYRESINEDTSFHLPYLAIAKGYQEAGDMEKAIQVVQDFMMKNPNHERKKDFLIFSKWIKTKL